MEKIKIGRKSNYHLDPEHMRFVFIKRVILAFNKKEYITGISRKCNMDYCTAWKVMHYLADKKVLYIGDSINTKKRYFYETERFIEVRKSIEYFR